MEKSDSEENPPDNNDPSLIAGSINLESGYDVFENYTEYWWVKAFILDIDKLNADGLIKMKTVENRILKTV